MMDLQDAITRMADLTQDAILLLDARPLDRGGPRVVWSNAAFSRLTGCAGVEVLGGGLCVLRSADTTAEVARKIDAALAAGRTLRQEFNCQRKDGTTFCAELDIAPVADDEGVIRFWTARLRDISGFKERERAARRESEALAAVLAATQQHVEAAEQRLQEVLEALPDGFALYDAEDRLLYANHAFKDLHRGVEDMIEVGASFEEIVRAGLTRGLWDLSGQDPEDWMRVQLEARSRTVVASTIVQLSDGRWMQRNDRRLASGEIVGLRIDITQSKAREQALLKAQGEAELAKERLLSAIEAIHDAFVVYDADDRLVICNEQYRRTYPWLGDEIQPGIAFETVVRSALDRGMQPAAVGCEEEWLQTRLKSHRNPNGEPFEQELPGDRHVQIREQRTANGDLVQLRVDVTELKRQQRRSQVYACQLEQTKREVEAQALQDALTGLPNRRHLETHIQKLSQDASQRCAETRVALLHVDLDRFKQINDTLGHAAGDHVLQHVATVLRASTRPGDFAARIGGDEFVVLCVFRVDAADPMTIAERIVKELSRPTFYEGRECRFGASVGVAIATFDELDLATLLIDADVALYHAKETGRGRVELFSPQLKRQMQKIKSLADDLTKALERDELVPFFQPQFDAATLDFVGVEALARWRHPTLGILPPSEFLPIATDMRLLKDVDRTIFERALQVCRDLEIQGQKIPKLAANIGADRLNDIDFLDCAETSGFSGRVALELLETIFFEEQSDGFFWTLNGLREAGFIIEVDDFGSGRASLLSLTKINPHGLKIDKGLILPAVESETHQRLVSAIIEMARALDISVTAEGIETAAHADLLRASGCRVLQGFHFSRPLPPEELGPFLRSDAWRSAPTASRAAF